MKTVKSAKRVRFEKDTFPHVEALWRTALWLTKRWSYAEDLVLKTMTEAYHLWTDSAETIGSKARLFRILNREFSNAGYPKHPRDRYFPERSAAAAKNGNGDGQCAGTSIDQQGMSLLTGTSGVAVRGAIARLRPESRLIMILKNGEQFSYVEIAYIAGLRKDSIRSILGRLRRLIPQYLVKHVDCLITDADSHPTMPVHNASSECDQCRK